MLTRDQAIEAARLAMQAVLLRHYPLDTPLGQIETQVMREAAEAGLQVFEREAGDGG
jgi:hypothetical protein